MVDEEFERIVEDVRDLSDLGAAAPDGFVVLIGADGSEARVSRIEFMEHANAVLDALKDHSLDVSAAVLGVVDLPPLVRRVVLETASDEFALWVRTWMPLEYVQFSAFQLTTFVRLYRGLIEGAPEYSGTFYLVPADSV